VPQSSFPIAIAIAIAIDRSSPLPRCRIAIDVAPINKDIMSSNENKRGSSPGSPHDKTPSKRSKTGSNRSFATAMATIDRNCNGNGERGLGQWQWHWSRGNRTVIAMAMGQRSIVFLSKRNVYVLFRGSMSWIVVDKNVQNLWTAMIQEFGPRNKTCMI
jgi:hypothetical protein